MATPDGLCSEVAEKQFGLITRRQAIQTGMSAAGIGRRLASRRWFAVLPGVYRMAGAPTSWEQSVKAATLWGGDRCAASHETAAVVHGLASSAVKRVHVQSPKQLQRANIVTHRTRFADSQYITWVKGIPTTSVTRTLIDLSASLPSRSLEKVLDESIRRGMTDIGRLRGVLSRSGDSRRGARVLRGLIESRDGSGERSDSALEDEVIRLIRSRRMPLPVIHYNVIEDDRWLGEVDLAYPHERIAIEVHGYRVHSLKRVWENDQRRENELVRAGWKLLKATSLQLTQDPDSFLDALESLHRASRTKGRW